MLGYLSRVFISGRGDRTYGDAFVVTCRRVVGLYRCGKHAAENTRVLIRQTRLRKTRECGQDSGRDASLAQKKKKKSVYSGRGLRERSKMPKVQGRRGVKPKQTTNFTTNHHLWTSLDLLDNSNS